MKHDDINYPVIVDIGSCSKNKPAISLQTASPEALKMKTLTYKHDTWTLGVLYMECTTRCSAKPKLVGEQVYPWYTGKEEEMNMLHNDIYFRTCTHFDPVQRKLTF